MSKKESWKCPNCGAMNVGLGMCKVCGRYGKKSSHVGPVHRQDLLHMTKQQRLKKVEEEKKQEQSTETFKMGEISRVQDTNLPLKKYPEQEPVKLPLSLDSKWTFELHGGKYSVIQRSGKWMVVDDKDERVVASVKVDKNDIPKEVLIRIPRIWNNHEYLNTRIVFEIPPSPKKQVRILKKDIDVLRTDLEEKTKKLNELRSTLDEEKEKNKLLSKEKQELEQKLTNFENAVDEAKKSRFPFQRWQQFLRMLKQNQN